MPMHPRQLAGFTIIELIVAIALTSMLAFMVNTLFFETTRAVQVGVRTGDMLVTSETIGDQLRRDAKRMNGPNRDSSTWSSSADDAPGVLVIANRLFVWNEGANGTRVNFEGDERQQSVRSDQLAFITHRTLEDEGAFRALTPENEDQFHNANAADHARVWYGHVLRTDEDGMTPADALLPNTSPANYWVLGRQQMLLTGGASGTSANYFTYDAAVTEAASGSSQSPYSSSSPPPPLLYHGLTDVSNRSLFGDPSSLIEQLVTPTGPADDYGNLAADLAFVRNANTRLHVNPLPEPQSGMMESWQLAQMHAILAMGVSDFIVEFAGDYRDSPGVDNNLGNDDLIDRDEEGYIMWYSLYYNNPEEERNYATDTEDDPNNLLYYAALPRSYNAMAVHSSSRPVFQDLDESNSDLVHHAGIVGDYFSENADAVFVFRHDDENASDPDYESKWPHLIRIRYRLQDPRGMVTSSLSGGAGTIETEPTAGRWFEHVMRVPRP